MGIFVGRDQNSGYFGFMKKQRGGGFLGGR